MSTRTDSPNGADASTHGRVVGCGDRLTSVVHVRDAAAATVLAVTSGAPGIYKVVDDEPAPLRDRLPAYADALGAKPPHRVPRRAARLMRGKFIADIRLGASNAKAKAKAELGWRPALTSWREGFRSALDSDPAAPPRDPGPASARHGVSMTRTTIAGIAIPDHVAAIRREGRVRAPRRATRRRAGA